MADRNKKDFYIALKILRDNLNNEDYNYVTGVMRSLKYRDDFEFNHGYDSEFDNAIFQPRTRKRKNNILKFKIGNGD